MKTRRWLTLISWERTLELAYLNHRVITEVNKKQQVNWLLVDLGLENITEEQINEIVDKMLIGFNRLCKYKSLQQVSLGYFRMLDILKKGQLYYPRIHILLPMIKSYFQGRYYIKYDNWISLWGRALGIEDGLHVTVKVVSGKENGREILQDKLLKFHELKNKMPIQKNETILPRRLIGYSKLVKDVSDHLINDRCYHMHTNELCINDAIATCAFMSMLDWHPGLRLEEKILL